MLNKEREVAVSLARQAGAILLDGWQRPGLAVERKGETDPVTEIDRSSEALIVRGLEQAFPGCGILAEEGTQIRAHERCRWIIDPLDGTMNYIKGYPMVAVSIGLEVDEKPVLGVVFNPVTDELFVGEAGKGAILNGEEIGVSQVDQLGEAMIASGFPYDVWTSAQDNLETWKRIAKQAMTMRCDGSAALDLCWVACGRLDGYWEKGLSPWDMAAGIVIVREAGGVVTDFLGRNDMLPRREIVAGNPPLVKVLRKAVYEMEGIR